ncbi:MAG: magnesium transporter CorA family protein [Sandaracinobacter sp.]
MLRLHLPDQPTEPLTPEQIAAGPDALGPLPTADAIRSAVWVDLAFPLNDEVEAVESALGVALPAKADMMAIEASSRVYHEDGAHVMNLLLVVGVDSGTPSSEPVSLVMTDSRLITVRYSDPRAFRTLEASCVKGAPGSSAQNLLVRLLEAAVDRTADILERMGEEIDSTSQLVFGLDRPAGARISNTDLQQILRRIGATQLTLNKVHDSLVTLLKATSFLQTGPGTDEGGRGKWDKILKERVKSISRDVMSLSENASFLTQNVGFMLDAALGRISIEQNAIVKIFSVAAVIFLPPTLVASIYGMNFEFMPELRFQFGYPMALGMMVLSAVLPYLWFKRKGWL